MTDVYSSVGLTTTGDLSTYDVRTYTPGKAADNKSYVSSKTGGKTFRVKGNLDATWEISIYAKDGESEIPSDLRPGKIISVQFVNDSQTYTMMIDSSSVEIDVEAGELVSYALSTSADSDSSYNAAE